MTFPSHRQWKVSTAMGLLCGCTLISCQRPPADEQKSLEHLERSARYIERGQFKEAMQESVLAKKEQPLSDLVWINRAQIQRGLGNTNESIASAYKAVQLAETNMPPPYPFAISLLLGYGKLNEAEALLKVALKDPVIQSRDIPHARVLLVGARLNSSRGDQSKALADCDKALGLLPSFDDSTRADILMMKAQCLTVLGRESEAAEFKKQADALLAGQKKETENILEQMRK